MAAKYILGALGVAFLIMGLARLPQGGPHGVQSRAWLLIGAMFSVVSLWLFVNP